MQCEEVHNRFTDSLTGDLPEKDSIAIQSHLASCSSCRAEFESLQTIWTRLGTIPLRAPDAALMRQRFDDILDNHRQKDPRSVFLMRLWPRRPVFQIALVMVMLVGVVFAAQQTKMLVTLRIIPPPVEQQPAPLPKSNLPTPEVQPAAEGPASLEGVLVASGSGQPISRATLYLEMDGLDTMLGIPSGQNPSFKQGYVAAMRVDSPGVVDQVLGGRPFQLTATSDESGKFTFSDIQPGRYVLSAMRNGYIAGEYGQRSTGTPGVPIVLANKQELKDLHFAMTPASLIAGRVLDSSGDPIASVMVQVLKYTYPNNQRTLMAVAGVSTNDIGEFRLSGLQPGRYILCASPIPSFGRGGSTASVLAPVYYPGLADISSAAAIDVTMSDTLSGITLTLKSVHAARVAGRLIADPHVPSAGSALVRLVPKLGQSIGPLGAQGVNTNGSGAFEFSGVTPGDYYVIANPGIGRGNAGSGIAGQPLSSPSGALATIHVENADVRDLNLTLQPAFEFTGRINIEGQQDSRGLRMTTTRIRLQPVAPSAAPGVSSIGDDGVFTIRNVVPGDYRLMMSGLPSNTFIKSAELDGVDVLSSSLRLDRAPTGNLEIVLGMNAAVLDVRVLDSKQDPVSGVTVVIVPDTALRGRFDLYRTAASDAAGRAHFDGIAPGNFKVFAWEKVETGSWFDPDFLQEYEVQGKTIRATTGIRATTDLKMIPMK